MRKLYVITVECYCVRYEMKLALTFLLAFVVATSYQQFPFNRHAGAPWWLSPYARAGPEHRGFYEDEDLTEYDAPEVYYTIRTVSIIVELSIINPN